jgi:ubiquinone/menaquinone biosynthesis C-methylase UbiE
VTELLAKHVKGKTIVELGCGSGYFAARLYRAATPARITGIDFSPAAIRRGREYMKSEGLENAIALRVGDVAEIALPDGDFTIGLGLLDYLDSEAIRELFRRIRSPRIVFTFSRPDVSALRLAQRIYLATQRCPSHFYYSEEALASLIGTRFGRLTFVADRRRMSFGGIVHNLPTDAA